MVTLPERGYITRPQLAAAFGVEEKTLLLWEREHGMPVLGVGYTRVYNLAEVWRWLRARSKRK